MTELRIEPATLDDLPLMAELLEDLFIHSGEFRPNREKQIRGLQLILERPDRGRIFVLRNNSRIVAMINLLFTISTAEGGFVMLLEDLIVHADHRGQGFGSQLLDYALSFAREKKFLRISLLTPSGNGRLVNFYKNYGFVESEMVTMRLPVSSEKENG